MNVPSTAMALVIMMLLAGIVYAFANGGLTAVENSLTGSEDSEGLIDKDLTSFTEGKISENSEFNEVNQWDFQALQLA